MWARCVTPLKRKRARARQRSARRSLQGSGPFPREKMRKNTSRGDRRDQLPKTARVPPRMRKVLWNGHILEYDRTRGIVQFSGLADTGWCDSIHDFRHRIRVEGAMCIAAGGCADAEREGAGRGGKSGAR